MSQVYLVDLASCEKPTQNNNSVIGYQEGVILKSHFRNLKLVLKQLSNGIVNEAIIKDCKLTKILRPIFEVNNKIIVISHAIELIECYDSTVSILLYSENLRRGDLQENDPNDDAALSEEDEKFKKMSQEHSSLKNQLESMRKVIRLVEIPNNIW